MIRFSYSSLNAFLEHPHSYLNRLMGNKTEDKAIFIEGKKTHRRIQDHVSNRQKDPVLMKMMDLPYFPVVETRDFDSRTAFSYKFEGKGVKERYEIIGFADGLNPTAKKMLEIKSSASSLWGIAKFQASIQRKLYTLGFPWVETQQLITCLHDMSAVKLYTIVVTEQDRYDAEEWLCKGLTEFERTQAENDFYRDLDVNGNCDGFCYYGKNCFFYSPERAVTEVEVNY